MGAITQLPIQRREILWWSNRHPSSYLCQWWINYCDGNCAGVENPRVPNRAAKEDNEDRLYYEVKDRIHGMLSRSTLSLPPCEEGGTCSPRDLDEDSWLEKPFANGAWKKFEKLGLLLSSTPPRNPTKGVSERVWPPNIPRYSAEGFRWKLIGKNEIRPPKPCSTSSLLLLSLPKNGSSEKLEKGWVCFRKSWCAKDDGKWLTLGLEPGLGWKDHESKVLVEDHPLEDERVCVNVLGEDHSLEE